MKTTSIKWIAQSLGVMALVTFGSAAMANSTWSENLATTTNSPNVTLTAYSTGTGIKAAPTVTAGSNFVTAALGNYGSTSGLGITGSNEYSTVTGPHAIDNAFGIEALMLNFTGGPVNLSSLQIGWNGTDCATTTNSTNLGTKVTGCNNSTYSSRNSATPTNNTSTNPLVTTYNDSDLSVFAWIGGNTGPTLTAMSDSNLLSSGWKLVGNYFDVGTIGNPVNTQSISSTLYSSYWLISAYSANYARTGDVSDSRIDAFKVLTIAGNTCDGGNTVSGNACGSNSKVPEPGSLALLGLGLVGLVATRRRSQKAA